MYVRSTAVSGRTAKWHLAQADAVRTIKGCSKIIKSDWQRNSQPPSEGERLCLDCFPRTPIVTHEATPSALQGSMRLLKAQHKDVWADIEAMWGEYLQDSVQADTEIGAASFAAHVLFMIGFKMGQSYGRNPS